MSSEAAGTAQPFLSAANLPMRTPRDHALWAAYLLRDLRKRVDPDRIGRSRMMGISTEIGDAILPTMVAEKTPMGWWRALCARFESDPTPDGHSRGYSAAAFTPEGNARWDTVISRMDARVLRLVLSENPQVFATFACDRPYEGEHLLFDAFGTAPTDAPMPARVGHIATVIPRRYWSHWHATSPTAHGADGKSGNVSLFRRQRIVDAATGRAEMVPFIAGNAIRGGWRDRAMIAWLGMLGLTATDIPPRMAHALLAGGSLSAGADTQRLDVRLRRDFRRLCPMWDIFAGCVEDQVMQGRGRVADATLVCRENAWKLHAWLAPTEDFETWRASLKEASELTTLRLATRSAHRDIADSDGVQMLVNTELVVEGASWVHSLSLRALDDVGSVTASALAWLLEEFQSDAYVGAQNARGFGSMEFHAYRPSGGAEPLPSSSIYVQHVLAHREEAREWLSANRRAIVAEKPAKATKGKRSAEPEPEDIPL